MPLLSFIASALLLSLAGSAGRPATATLRATDTDGKSWSLLSPAPHEFDLLFFVSTDCPISNRYAPEITRICADYRARGVRCFLVYPDTGADAGAVSAHRRDYGLSAAAPAIIDRDHALVRAVGPRVTPEAALYSSTGRVYRGRIDAALAGRSITPAETEAVGCFIAKP